MTEPRSPAVVNGGNRLHVAAIGDVHATTAAKGQWREPFAEISHVADVLCLCGDLTNLGTRLEAESLAEDLRACAIPVFAVLGNHDYHSGQSGEVERVLCDGGVNFLEDEVHIVKGVGFAGVKGFCGGFDGRMLAAFGEPANNAFVQEPLDQALRLAAFPGDRARTVVLLHYSPITQTLSGEAESIYPFLGSSRLAESIDRFDEVRAVFHGHAHHGIYEGHTRKGIPAYNVAVPVPKPGGKSYALIEV